MAKKKAKQEVVEESTASNEALNKVVSALEKKFGKGTIIDATKEDFSSEDVRHISSGDIALDIVLGGGWERGRTHKIQGRWSAGKSKMMVNAASVLTGKYGERVLYVDIEKTSTPDFFKVMGANIELLKFAKPGSAEEAFDIVEAAYMSGAFSGIFLDSLAVASPQEELDKSHAEATQAKLARLSNIFFRKLQNRQHTLDKAGIEAPTFWFSNQIRTNIHARFDKDTTPGGGMQDNASSTILDLFRKANITEGSGEEENVCGFWVSGYTKKLKTGFPHKRTDIGIITEPGFEGHSAYSFYHGDSIMRLAQKTGLISQSGAWYTIDALGIKEQGASKIKTRIMVDDEVRKFLVDSIKGFVSTIPIAYTYDLPIKFDGEL